MPKKFLSALATFVGVVVFLGIVAWVNYRDLVHPYTWDDAYRVQASADGWEIFQEVKVGDLVLPWTWFWTPSGSLSFARPDLIVRDGPRVAAWVFTVRREESARVREEIFAALVDCDRGQFAVVDEIGLDSHPADFVSQTPTHWMEASDSYKTFFCEDSSGFRSAR